MWRRNQLVGWILLAFGSGLLIGLCLESCFLFAFIGLGLIVGGVRQLCRH